MKINFQSVKQLAILGVASLVISCGGGDGAVPVKPAPIPEGGIEGVVMLGPVSDATITAYKIDPKDGAVDRENPLYKDNKSTNASGFYSFDLPISVPELPILICATGGRYTEPASAPNNFNADKTFSRTQELCAMTIYKKTDAEAKKKTIVNITFFTHLAYGLLNSKLAYANPDEILGIKGTDGGAPKIGLLDQSNRDVASWLKIDNITTIEPIQISDASNGGKVLTPEYAYGLALAGISSMVDWLATTNGQEQTFEGVSSIEFAQLAYEDIKAERGQLDGRGPSGPLKMKGTKLDAHIYRHHLSSRIMAVIVNGDINKTQLTLNSVKTFVDQIATHTATVFDSGASTNGPIAENKPTITHEAGTLDVSKLLSETIKITATITDLTGIQSALLTVYKTVQDANDPSVLVRGASTSLMDLQPLPQDANKAFYAWEIDTTSVPDGGYEFEIVATNNRDAGITSKLIIDKIKIGNSPVSVNIVYPAVPLAQSNNPDNAFFNEAHIGVDIADGFSGTNVVFDLIDIGNLTPNSPKIDIKNATAVKVLTTPPITSTGTSTTKRYEYGKFKVAPLNLEGKFYLRVIATQTVPGVAAKDQAFDVAIRKFAIDTTNPTITYDATPANKDVVSTATITLTGQVNDPAGTGTTYNSGVIGASAHIGSSRKDGTVTGNSATVDVSLPADKWSLVQLGATDAAGNHQHATASRNFAYDLTPPTVSLSSSNPALSTTGQINWVRSISATVAVEDAVGIDKIFYTIRSGTASLGQYNGVKTIRTSPDVQSYKFTIPSTPNSVSPAADIFVVAKDWRTVNGETSKVVLAGVGFDTLKPSISFTAPVDPTAETASLAVYPPTTTAQFTVGTEILEPNADTLGSSGLASVTVTVAKPLIVQPYIDLNKAGSAISDKSKVTIASVSSGSQSKNTFLASYPTTAPIVHTATVREQWDYDVTADCSGMPVDFTTGTAGTSLPTGIAAASLVQVPDLTTLAGFANKFGTVPIASAAKVVPVVKVTGAASPTKSVCYGVFTYNATPAGGAVTSVTHYFSYPTALNYVWTARKTTANKPVKNYVVEKTSVPKAPATNTFFNSTSLVVSATDRTLPDNNFSTGNTATSTFCMTSKVIVAPNTKTGTAYTNNLPLPLTVTPLDQKAAFLKKTGNITSPTVPAATFAPAAVAGATTRCKVLPGNINDVTTNPGPAVANSRSPGTAVACGLYVVAGNPIDIVDDQSATGSASGIWSAYTTTYSSKTLAASVTACP